MRPRKALSALDRWIMRRHFAISLVTGALAVLGVGIMFLGIASVSPLPKVLSPF